MITSQKTDTTEYLGSFQYKNQVLVFIHQPEGYIDVKKQRNYNIYNYVYHYKDHLGNIRLSYTDANKDGVIANYNDPKSGQMVKEILEENNYYPFGLKHQNYNTGIRKYKSIRSIPRPMIIVKEEVDYKYKYQGQERQDELGLDWYDYGARNYDASLGRWMNVDPLADAPANISWSPYTYVWNNPLNFIDPDGRHGQSTHTDEDGNVIAVYDDGDLGVYTHSNGTKKADLDANHSISNTSANGSKIGETEHWDEFVSPETGKTMTNTQIQIGKSFDPIISEMSKKADGMGLYQIAQESRPGGDFDIKGPYKDVGGLLNGKYVTSRSAGNYLAGYNANNGVISYTTFQKLAGKLHKGKYSKMEAMKTVLYGDYIGSPPTYGEDIYQLRMSIQGWSDKGKTGSNIDLNQFKRTPTNGLKW